MSQEALTCPSCGGRTPGPYCSTCGEKVKVDKNELRLSHFLKDAFEELFNLDSKFVKTFRYLILRPGFLTNEVLAGRRVNYIKPFRLYTILIVIHFLAFSFFKSGDIFSIDRMPIFKIIPGITEVIANYEADSGLTHEEFAQSVNPKMKDNLNLIFYFLVFILALYMKLVFYKSKKLYVEHLYFLLHVMSFGLTRNILMIPFVIWDLIPLAFVIAAVTQISYTWFAVKNVYKEKTAATLIKMVVVIVGFIFVFMPALVASLMLAMLQTVY